MRVLVVDDEKGLRDSIAEYLSFDGYQVQTAENGLSAERFLDESDFDAVVMDLKMPGADGLEVLAWMKDRGISVPVIMISAFGEVSDAVSAMKLGAEDYLVKPFESEELSLRVARAVRLSGMRREIEMLRSSEDTAVMSSENPAMRDLIKLAERAAPTPSNILVTGESGTGKEVLARHIHRNSPRNRGPFVPLNIGSMPENLLESELFGYEKGSFTGAVRMKQGLFETAGGGTLFLDEIGDMPLHLQVKLLRAIQDRTIQRIGSVERIKLDVRIIAATNRPLEQDVADGRFREDLFYRLNVVRLHLPPLRDRLEDIPALCAAFIIQMNRKMGRSVKGVSSEALTGLQQYRFPGNIRELENLVERAFILSSGDILELQDFGLHEDALQHKSQRSQGKLRDIERQAISESLARWEGRKGKAAEELGIDRKTLFNKIREYGLE